VAGEGQPAGLLGRTSVWMVWEVGREELGCRIAEIDFEPGAVLSTTFERTADT
jgi:hypothetical protein